MRGAAVEITDQDRLRWLPSIRPSESDGFRSSVLATLGATLYVTSRAFRDGLAAGRVNDLGFATLSSDTSYRPQDCAHSV